jgi:hypothetical protein
VLGDGGRGGLLSHLLTGHSSALCRTYACLSASLREIGVLKSNEALLSLGAAVGMQGVAHSATATMPAWHESGHCKRLPVRVLFDINHSWRQKDVF